MMTLERKQQLEARLKLLTDDVITGLVRDELAHRITPEERKAVLEELAEIHACISCAFVALGGGKAHEA